MHPRIWRVIQWSIYLTSLNLFLRVQIRVEKALNDEKARASIFFKGETPDKLIRLMEEVLLGSKKQVYLFSSNFYYLMTNLKPIISSTFLTIILNN